jgi:hypothetical protein
MRARPLPFTLGAILLGTVLSGQALTDHAAAIAGASAGVAGATAIRDPLTRILDAASGAAGTAAAEAPVPDKRTARSSRTQSAAVPATAPAQFSPAPSTPGRTAWRSGTGERSVLPVGQAPFNRYESSAPAAAPVTVAQLRSVASGASRAEVIGSLGSPAARITMDDNGHLVEILQYTSNGNRVGSVRCSDGRVESVNAAQ